MPLSFREFCEFKGIDHKSWMEDEQARIRNAFNEYNNQGGFPEPTLIPNILTRTKVLQGYFDTMMLKDLAEHFGISNIEVLRYFLKRIMANITKPTSIRAIHNDLKSRGLKVSKDNLYDWATHACDIFMFLRVPNYSRSLQKTEASLPKFYCIDNGLRDAVLIPQSNDDGKKLENTVFLQLYRKRTPIDQIFYFQGKGECDFVVQRGIEIESLIQVTWEMNLDETRKREIEGIREASDATGCLRLMIITHEDEEVISLEDGRQINVVPAWKWLLERLGPIS